jgi:2-dehydro-3-deoxyphosphogluconate aldolase/(4S)-4-hydroxy-2-oxoglutarate aldolase
MNSSPSVTTDPGVLQTRDVFLEDGVVLCVRLSQQAGIVDACRAAGRGGLKILEVTLTTPGALEIIKTLSEDEDLVVGAGTVLSPEDVGPVADAGGRFALSPVFDPEVVDEAHRIGLLAVPGAATPREILTAHRHGATIVKVFPAAALGGPNFLRAVRGPLPDIPLMPTSGPSAETIGDYLAAGAVAVGVGREVFTPEFTLESVEKASRRLRRAMDEARKGA